MRFDPPAAVLFDFDGTLADSEPLITAAMIYALGTEGFTVTAGQVREVFGPPFHEMAQLLVGALSEQQIERLRTAYSENYRAEQLPRVRPIPGAAGLLDALDRCGIPFALVTNKSVASAEEQLAHLGWSSRFAHVIGWDLVPRPKPAPDAALLALHRLGVTAERAAYVGDQTPDMECATGAGIPVIIGLAHARGADSLAAAGATYVAGTLTEVEAMLLRGETICA